MELHGLIFYCHVVNTAAPADRLLTDATTPKSTGAPPLPVTITRCTAERLTSAQGSTTVHCFPGNVLNRRHATVLITTKTFL